MDNKLFLSEMAKDLRISSRAMRNRINDTHKDFWKGKVINGYRKSVERADYEKYLSWLKRSNLK